MIKASEAYKQSFDTDNEKVKNELDALDRDIKNHIKTKPGTTSMFIYKRPHSLVIKELEANGYKFTSSTDPRGEYTGTISWDIADNA